jgi:hypothetical protein
MSSSGLSRVQNLTDGRSQSAPRVRLSLQLFSPAAGQLIVFGLPIVPRNAPTGFYPSAAFQPVKGRIQGPLFNLKRVARHLLNTFGNRPSVLRFEGYGLED